MPKVIDGTSVVFSSHTSACTSDPPNCTLCLPRNHVAVSSTTFVPASRAEFVDWPVPLAVTPLAMLVRLKPVPQHAVSNRSRYPPVTSNMLAVSSGENNVAPPVPPTRNSLTRLLVNVVRSDSDVVQRVDCWLPVAPRPGNEYCWLLVVSGVELM